MALTRITKGVIKPNENYDTHNIVSTGIVTSVGLDVNGNADVSGSLSVGGVLTYEDVTSIDSVGIITARSGLVSPYADIDDFVSVGSNIHLGNAGVVTATSFVGSGAALTGIDATAIKDSGGNVKVQAQASGAMYTGIHTFSSGAEVGSNIKLGNAGVVTATSFSGAIELSSDSSPQLGGDLDTNGFDINLDANKYLTFGSITSGGQIYHTNAHFYMWNDTGNIYIQNSGTSTNEEIHLRAKGGENSIRAIANGAVELYYDNSKKLHTVTNGIDVTGMCTDDGARHDGDVYFIGGTSGRNAVWDMSDNTLEFADNAKLALGSGTDLLIYHDGSNSLIRSGGTGQLQIESSNNTSIVMGNAGLSETIFKGSVNGAVELYHDNSKKFETSAKGIKVGTGVTVETNGQATYVGIVTASAFKLSDGSNVGGVESDSSYNTLGGTGAGAQLTGSSLRNTFFGWDSGTAQTGGEKNTYVGAIAGKFQNNSNYNTGFGDAALCQNSGSFNTGVGYQALAGESERLTMEHNVAVGYNALRKLDDPGDFNIAVGSRSLENCVSGISNIAIGYKSLFTDSSGYDNVAIGSSSGLNLTTGSHSNVIVGTRAADAMQGNSSLNVFIGKDAFGNCTGGNQNVAIGYQALGTGSPSISGNVALGGSAGASVTDNYNTFVGHQAGDSLVHGGNNIIIGYNADASSTSADNEITLGNSSITKFRIPGINVTLKDNGGTPTQGHVLTVDGSGEAGFAAASGVSVANQADNRLITATGTTDALNGESTLTYNGNRLFAPSISATDNGAGSPLLSLRQDDQNPWAFEIGNDTYGTGTNGLMGYVENGGDMLIRYRGVSAYKSLTIEQHDGTNNRAWMTLGNGGNVVLSYQGNTKLTTASGGVNVTGDLTASGFIDSSSDIKLKTNIKTIDNALDKVLQLRGAEYDRIDRDNQHEIGVIAQEVEKIIPEVVHGDETKTVSYGNLVGLLIEAVKDLKKEIDELKSS